MATKIKLRGDTGANWSANNPVLDEREVGIETDSSPAPKLKIGNGVDDWTTLPYVGGVAAVAWGDILGTLTDQTDLASALSGKEATITAGTTGQYWRGDKSWQTLDKTAVGLPNVDNTADSAKPVSTLQSAAISAAQTNAETYADGLIASLIASSPATLDTLNELAAALGNDPNFATTMATALGNRLRVDTAAQGLNSTEKTNAKTNLDLQNVVNLDTSTTANITDSTNKRFMSDAQETKLDSVESNADVTDAVNVGTSIDGTSEKLSVANNDLFSILDSAASNVLKKLKWSTIVSALNSLYATISHNHAGTDITSGTIDGDRLPAMSTTKKGAVPLTGTPSGKYLKDDGSWDTPAGGGGGVSSLDTATGTVTLGSVINGLAAKANPIDADSMVLSDSADSSASKKFTFANLKSFLGVWLGFNINVDGGQFNVGSTNARLFKWLGGDIIITGSGAGVLTRAGTNSGLLESSIEARLSSDFTLANVNTAQTCFPSTADQFTLEANTTYEIEGQYYIANGTTTHTTAISFLLSNGLTLQATNGFDIQVLLHSAAANTITTTQSTVHMTGVSSKVLNATSTAARTIVYFKGTIRTNVAGDLTPQLTFSAAPGGTNQMLANSWLKFTPKGAHTHNVTAGVS